MCVFNLAVGRVRYAARVRALRLRYEHAPTVSSKLIKTKTATSTTTTTTTSVLGVEGGRTLRLPLRLYVRYGTPPRVSMWNHAANVSVVVAVCS